MGNTQNGPIPMLWAKKACIFYMGRLKLQGSVQNKANNIRVFCKLRVDTNKYQLYSEKINKTLLSKTEETGNERLVCF